jgi:hypothetical protein
MSKIVSSRKTQSGLFDATSGAVVGNYNTGIFIPANSIIHSFTVKTLTTCVTGGGGFSTIEFFQGVGGHHLFTQIRCGGLIAGQSLAGVDFNANPENVQLGFEIILAITLDDLTTGKIVFEIDYTEFAI